MAAGQASKVRTTAFFFVASGAKGGRSLGLRRARSRRALAEGLKREKRSLVRSWTLPAWAAGPEPPASLKDQAAMNEQLGQLVSRGVPLVDALDVTEQVVSGAGAPRIGRIRDAVRAGKSFSEACRGVGGFDRVTIAIYAAAERSGDLAGAAARLAESARRQLAVRGKAVTLLIYPAIVMTISALVGVGMLTFIIPRVGSAMLKSGRSLPWITRAMMDAGNWLNANPLLALGIVGCVVILAIILREAIGKGISRLMHKLPLVREVVLAQELARFFGVMAAMTSSGIPLADALGVSNSAIGHPRLRRELEQVRQKLIEGGVFRTLVDRVESLPLSTRKLIVAADQAGDLESAFEALARDHTEEVEVRTERAMAALEPILIVIMFLIIGTMILSIMVPLMRATAEGV